VPAADEIERCSRWLDAEMRLLQPQLIIPVGRLAISRFLPVGPLAEIIGQRHTWQGRDVIPLPHPSGASTWFKKEPGLSLTKQALTLLGEHAAWRSVFGAPAP
jgi:uracil-DNA glycosylase